MKLSAVLILITCVQGVLGFLLPSQNSYSYFGKLHNSSLKLEAVKEVANAADFDGVIENADGKLVIVDYSTTWCGPCKIMAPKFDAMSEKYTGAVFVKVTGDASPDASKLMKREGVRAVPAFHFWKGGKKVDQLSGADPEKLDDAISSNL